MHDSLSPWLAWSDELLGFAVVLAPTDGPTEADPWFVRVADYPGLGLQLAARQPLTLPVGGGLARGLRALVVDGPHDGGEVRAWAAGTGAAVGGSRSRGRAR